ncbi:CocE/NonD family hydrolase [Saccharothrix luteola]|uniref:CocE/NonD family hydrolase n=1 Tax=Saccharothrix luteola TaxID=2893018 RepID=UPI001E2CFBEC|nr:CocE/NonD family hydrolase [Saccharothrix luteola]MCC8249558.1 X-Pro dipeptidyl-peptidase [Saccharothrix luteola]
MGPKTLTATVVSMLMAAATVTSTSTAAAQPAFVLHDGVTKPVYSYEKAIRETAWVETGQDLDRDGLTDRVTADIIRPSEPAARGQRVPVIMDVSPYFEKIGRGNERQPKTYLPDGTPSQFPLFYDNYFVPRGYAVVLVDVGGTNRSSGCFDDVASGNGVVNWLNGRAKAFRTPFGPEQVQADWANGSAGAIGKSQDGAAAIGMAASGIDGLKTIVPIAGVSSYYEVHNSHGAYFGWGGSGPRLYNERAEELCRPFEEDNARRAGTDGNFNEFWRERDYAAKTDRMRASVFVAQGFHDLNVNPIQFGPWWEALNAHHVPRKAWLHQAAHVDPFDLDRSLFVRTLHRWFDRWLLGVRNGIEFEPAIRIEHSPDQWVDERRWPPAGTRSRTLWPGTAGTLGRRPSGGSASLTDDPARGASQWVANPAQPSSERLVFTGEPLRSDTRIAGTATVTVTARSDKPSARLGAVLVDYGPATVRNTTFPAMGTEDLATRSCWGAGTPADTGCFLDTVADLTTVDTRVMATGWADLGHHRSLWRGEPLEPGKAYTMTFRLSSLDHVVPAGHRLALVLGGTDGDMFDPALPQPKSRITVELGGTSVEVPIVR